LPGCSAMSGVLNASKAKLHKHFIGNLSACADGVVDQDGGEECDGPLGCAAGLECTDHCTCVPIPQGTSTTTTLRTITTTSPTTTTTSLTTTTTPASSAPTTTISPSSTTTTTTIHPRGWSVARQWDEQALAAIRLDTPRPTV